MTQMARVTQGDVRRGRAAALRSRRLRRPRTGATATTATSVEHDLTLRGAECSRRRTPRVEEAADFGAAGAGFFRQIASRRQCRAACGPTRTRPRIPRSRSSSE